MATDNTTRVSLRLKNDVHLAIITAAAAQGTEPATYMQDVLEQAVIEYLPEERKRELANTKRLFSLAQGQARKVFAEGRFTEHFTLTVIQDLMADPEARRLYEQIIGTDAYADGVEGKTPLNMYLGWYIKNAISAQPVVDSNGNARRAFVKNEPIKSYTLLKAA